jgi:hypothetical protein
MKLPIEPTIRMEPGEKDVVNIQLAFPSFSVWNCIRWIFTGTIVYDTWWNCCYRIGQGTKTFHNPELDTRKKDADNI